MPVALALGAEGPGLRQLTRETCYIVSQNLACAGDFGFRHVSNAAAVGLYVPSSRVCNAFFSMLI